jgi:hypothetical protein
MVLREAATRGACSPECGNPSLDQFYGAHRTKSYGLRECVQVNDLGGHSKGAPIHNRIAFAGSGFKSRPFADNHLLTRVINQSLATERVEAQRDRCATDPNIIARDSSVNGNSSHPVRSYVSCNNLAHRCSTACRALHATD